MKFCLEITCKSVAFDNDAVMYEVAETLIRTANLIADIACGDPVPLAVRDTYGNRVGRAWVEISE